MLMSENLIQPAIMEEYQKKVPIPKEGELVSLPSGEPWSLVIDERVALHLLMEDT